MDWSEVIEAKIAPPKIALDSSGAGLKVAVIDSGVNFEHPHLATYEGARSAYTVDWEDGELVVAQRKAADRFGHGTCCAALIHFLAPKAELVAIRITADRAASDADRIAAGIEQGIRAGATILSVAFGTRTRLRALLDDAVKNALAADSVVVAAEPDDAKDDPVLPAACSGALAVGHKDGVDVVFEGHRYLAEGRARPAEGYESNFWGCSLSTSRTAAALARYAEASGLRGVALVQGFSKELDVR